MNKISWHVQAISACQWLPALVAETVARTGLPRYIKMMDCPDKNPFPPSVRVIGRTFVDDGESERMIRAGVAGGEEWYFRNAESYRKAGYVHAWEAWNEPQVPYGPDRPAYLSAFGLATATWVDLMHRAGYKTVVGNFGVGHPDVGVAARLGATLQTGDYLGLHEYAKRDMDMADAGERWYALRYRRTVDELMKAGYHVPPILIGECGLDNLLLGGAVGGWKMVLPPDGNQYAEYARQLEWYDSELQKDPLVEAAFVFTSGPCDPWQTYDVDEPLSRRLAGMMVAKPALDPQPILWAERVVDLRGKLTVHATDAYRRRQLGDIQYTVVHHSATSARATPQAFARYHVQHWDWPGIGYHFVIAADGRIFQTNDLETISYHSGDWDANVAGVGVCLPGDFTEHGPPVEQTNALIWLVRRLGYEVKAHKQVVQTGCPGDLRRKWWARVLTEGR